MCTEKTPWEQVTDFHGHACPGIALGFRIAGIAQREMGIRPNSDSELLVKAYTHSCALDAFQVLNHATTGRGTLILEEKHELVYQFHFSDTNELLQITIFQAVKERLKQLETENLDIHQLQNRNLEAIEYILSLREDDLCSMEMVTGKIQFTFQ